MGPFKWAAVLVVLVAVSFCGKTACSQTLYSNILTAASCYNRSGSPITVVTDGVGDFNCNQSGTGSNVYISTQMVGTCQDGNRPSQQQYVFLECEDAYVYQANGLGSYWEIPERDDCGDIIGYDLLGYVYVMSGIYYGNGEPMSTEWSCDDCDGNETISEPGVFGTTGC